MGLRFSKYLFMYITPFLLIHEGSTAIIAAAVRQRYTRSVGCLWFEIYGFTNWHRKKYDTCAAIYRADPRDERAAILAGSLIPGVYFDRGCL